jgi:hypothetical protein
MFKALDNRLNKTILLDRSPFRADFKQEHILRSTSYGSLFQSPTTQVYVEILGLPRIEEPNRNENDTHRSYNLFHIVGSPRPSPSMRTHL